MLNPSTNRDHISLRARLLSVLSALCLLIPLAALDLRAQGLPGQFTGTVYDPSGSAVANATIIMTNHSTNKVEMTTSGGEGIFKFEALGAGEYEMKVEKPGFEVYKASAIVLEAGRESSQNITLKVGSVTEELDVVAGETARSGAPPIHVRGDIQAARLLNKVQPVYPAAAKAAGVQGTVILHAIIGIEGNLLSLQVMNRQVDPDLARAAVEAVSKWRYSPTLLTGEPIEVNTTIKVNFTLSS